MSFTKYATRTNSLVCGVLPFPLQYFSLPVRHVREGHWFTQSSLFKISMSDSGSISHIKYTLSPFVTEKMESQTHLGNKHSPGTSNQQNRKVDMQKNVRHKPNAVTHPWTQASQS